MPGKMFYKDASGAGGPTSGSDKPWENPESGSVPSMPSSSPPPGYQWQLQTGPDGRKFWGVVAMAALGAIGSYMSARQANKPRTGYTDQTTTQSPYLAGMIQPDLEAILSYQRSLINQGPIYVGPESTWPQYRASQPGRAPGPVSTTYFNPATYRPGPPAFGAARPGAERGAGDESGPGGAGLGAGDPGEFMKAGGADSGPWRVRRSGELGDLGYLRALFASTGRG